MIQRAIRLPVVRTSHPEHAMLALRGALLAYTSVRGADDICANLAVPLGEGSCVYELLAESSTVRKWVGAELIPDLLLTAGGAYARATHQPRRVSNIERFVMAIGAGFDPRDAAMAARGGR